MRLSDLLMNRVALFGGAALATLVGTGLLFDQVTSVEASPAAAASETAAPGVAVRTLSPRKVQVWSTFSGRLTAVDAAALRPEVSGRLTEIRFRDGDTVKRGDILFVIDSRPYEAAVAKAKADLAAARNNAALARDELARAAKLMKTRNIATSVYDARANTARVADANVEAAHAALAQAEVDLDHAFVKAPIDGIISRAEITVGNVVQAGGAAPVLASIVSDDGIYADFEVDEATFLSSQRGRRGAGLPVELSLRSDGATVYRGTLSSFDNRIDTASGTIRARARFENSDGTLVPGMFVSVRLAAGTNDTALLVPERAVGTDQAKKFVYTVDTDSKTAYREVTLGAAVGAERIVTAGLQPGDRVVLDGIQTIQPGAAVRVTETVADNSATRWK